MVSCGGGRAVVGRWIAVVDCSGENTWTVIEEERREAVVRWWTAVDYGGELRWWSCCGGAVDCGGRAVVDGGGERECEIRERERWQKRK